MTLAKRLHRIKTSLTPKQAVLLWLKEVQQLDPPVFAERSFKCPMSEAPLVRIPKLAEKAAYESLSKKGLKPEMASRLALEAWKQGTFLVDLVFKANELAHDDFLQSRADLRFLLVYFGYLGNQFNEHDNFPVAAWDSWRETLVETLTRMSLLKATVATISKQYFDSHPLLFADGEDSINRRIECAEMLAKDYNGLKGVLPSWTAIDIAAFNSLIAPKVAHGSRTTPFPGAVPKQGSSSVHGYMDRLRNLGMSDVQLKEIAENCQLPDRIDIVCARGRIHSRPEHFARPAFRAPRWNFVASLT